MDSKSTPFVPPAPELVRRERAPGIVNFVRTAYRNSLEIWGEPSYTEPWIKLSFLRFPMVIANDPGLVKHLLVDNVKNYRLGVVRQLLLRPILRDGLLTIDGTGWKRARKAMAPVFTPRNIFDFASSMRSNSDAFSEDYHDGEVVDISHDMTRLTFNILSDTLFSGQVSGAENDFEGEINRLLDVMGRPDPFDIFRFPVWVPRPTRIGKQRVLKYFRNIVRQTIADRRALIAARPDAVPSDFLTLLLAQEGADGLPEKEIEDNVITFIGAGHETTARALTWTLYLLSQSPADRELVEAEVDQVLRSGSEPSKWLNLMPKTRAAFEEALRLYPPAPTIARHAVEDDQYQDLKIEAGTEVLVMPWTIHRHRLYWDNPEAFIPSRFWPENREQIDRYQYLPFGTGPRVCIGASFALQEAVIAFVSLLSRWRFEFVDEKHPWPVQKLTIQPDGPVMMQVYRR